MIFIFYTVHLAQYKIILLMNYFLRLKKWTTESI